MEEDDFKEPANQELRKGPYRPFLNSKKDFEAFIWGKPTVLKTFSESLIDIEEDSYVFKTFNNAFETDNLLSDDNIRELENGTLDIDSILKKYEGESSNNYFDLSSLSFLPIQSVLSRNEMTQCLEVYWDICNNKKLLGEKLELYNKYKAVIEHEQEEFLQIAEENWNKTNFCERPNFIKPEVLKYTSKLWKERLERLHWYPNLYMRALDMPLIDDSERLSQLHYIQNLKVLGNSPWLNLHTSNFQRFNIYSGLNELDCENINLKEVDFSYKPVHTALLQKGYHPDVSKDEIAESLANKFNAQIVISESGFLRLFNVYKDTLTAPWDLPIVIKELENSKKKVVYIDKALPQKGFTIAQRNNAFCKKRILDIFLEKTDKKKNTESDITQLRASGLDNDSLKSLVTAKRRSLRSNSSASTIESDNPNFRLHDSNTSLDDEYSDEAKSSKSFNQDSKTKLEKRSNVEEYGEADSHTDDELIIDTGEELQSPKTSKDRLSQAEKSHSKHDEPNLGDSPSKIKKTTNYQPLKTDYNLWCLKCDSSSVLLKSNLKDVNIIIRCKYSSKTRNRGKPLINQVISPKLDYQSQFGAEVLSLNEISQEWCRTFIRPGSQLLRVRLDPITGNIIMLEKKNLHDLTLEMRRLYSIEPNARLTAIHTIFDQLKNQPPGKYIISRNIKTGLFATLYKEDESIGTFNTRIDYMYVESDKADLSYHTYLPIDKMVLTPAFRIRNRIPAMFYPRTKKLVSNLSSCVPKEDTSISQKSRKRRKNKIKKQTQ